MSRLVIWLVVRDSAHVIYACAPLIGCVVNKSYFMVSSPGPICFMSSIAPGKSCKVKRPGRLEYLALKAIKS